MAIPVTAARCQAHTPYELRCQVGFEGEEPSTSTARMSLRVPGATVGHGLMYSIRACPRPPVISPPIPCRTVPVGHSSDDWVFSGVPLELLDWATRVMFGDASPQIAY